MKKLLFALIVLACIGCTAEHQKNELRAPAYPLITIDPYVSSWSAADNLYDDAVRHWTTSETPFTGVLRVDGVSYRFMGAETENKVMVAPMGYFGEWSGRYTFTKPAEGWEKPNFNDRSWKSGKAPFGNAERMLPRTKDWQKGKIWVRRTIELSTEELSHKDFYLYCSYDYGCKLYVNGVSIENRLGFCDTHFRWVKIPDEVISLTKNGKLVIAADCRSNRNGTTLFDVGLYRAVPRSNAPFEQTAEQVSADVQATRTIYDFRCGGVDLKLTFMAPVLLDNLDLVARPVNYVAYDVKANDGKKHNVEIYFEAGENWARHNQEQKCVIEQKSDNNFDYLRCGTEEQMILGRSGDNVRIDWGYFYLATPKGAYNVATGCQQKLRNDFVAQGTVTACEGNTMALSHSLGEVGNCAKSDYIMVGYDDIYSIQYFGENIRPYWNRNGDSTIEEQFALAAKEYKSLVKRCEKFDNELMAEAREAGGKEYAELCALAYRQAIAAHKLIETPQGKLAWVSKENFSNGCLGTVDVTYPSVPMFLCYNPEFVKAMMEFIFDYCESDEWQHPFPAHDIGRYPLANGQVYSTPMPVEESGNMLVMAGAISHIEGNVEYASKHWDILKQWADFLVERGLNTEDELCTDDFAGRMSFNANLSVKGIMGIAAFGDMARMAGKKADAEYYTAKARELAKEWKERAKENGYYRLTLLNEGTFTTSKGGVFDCKTSWSQKYNMVWDKVLGYNIFDDDIADTEIEFYLTKQDEYGLPLDSRSHYTKSDWVIWTATMADDDEDFKALIKPMHKFMNETVHRIPMTDFYYTDKPEHVQFRCRSVVGGYFMKMLDKRLND